MARGNDDGLKTQAIKTGGYVISMNCCAVTDAFAASVERSLTIA
jgi:hypothetical protein